MKYNDLYLKALKIPKHFGKNKLNKLNGFQSQIIILSKDKKIIRYGFEDGELNACYLALDKHIRWFWR